jgi:endonuclease-3
LPTDAFSTNLLLYNYRLDFINCDNTCFGWPTIAVDTHIDRVSNRTKFAMGKNVVEVEKKLLKVVPAEFKVDVHHWLILHGRYTCVARKPRCGSCIIEDLCEYKDKTD